MNGECMVGKGTPGGGDSWGKGGETGAMWRRWTYLLFVQNFHGAVIPVLPVFYEHHKPKGAHAKRPDSFELFQSGCVLGTEGLGGPGTSSSAACWAQVWVTSRTTSRGGTGEQVERMGWKNKTAEGKFLKAGGRGQIRLWPGARELLAAAWGAGAASWMGMVGKGAWQ